MDQELITRISEALIFASDTPLSIGQIRECIGDISVDVVEESINGLVEEYTNVNRAFLLKKVAGGYQFATKPEYYKWIKHLYEGRIQTRLSRAALETLAILAFKQPVTKVEVASIRGVNSDGVIKNLLMRKLINIMGRAAGPGRPLLYGTTPEFLRYFGINSIEDLPKPKEIEELLSDGEGAEIFSNFAGIESQNTLNEPDSEQ